jgi:antitoxin ParD1/3/4
MNVSLTPELVKFVADKIKSGMYGTASEVIREGLRLLAEKDQQREQKLAHLKALVKEGLDDLEAGRTVTLEEAFTVLRANNERDRRAQEARDR